MILDASVVHAALVDDGPTGIWCLKIMTATGLTAPHLLPVEVTSAIRRATSSGSLTSARSAWARQRLATLTIELVPFAPHAQRVWELRATLTAYDAWYVAVAEARGRPLATLDRRLMAAPGPRCTFVTAPA